MSSTSLAHSSSYALLVGISHYSYENTGWNDINGVNDIRILSGILQQNGFVIDTLTEKRASAKNIRNAMKKLTADIKAKDTIYIHFSGHGQPVEDTNGDELDGWDEAFVPIDAQMWYKSGIYEGQNHITDDDYNIFFNKIRQKIGKDGLLFVVFDACHSGTMSRAETDTAIEDDAPVRGTYIGLSKEKIYHPVREKQQINHYAIQTENHLAPITILEACQAWQQNTEVLIEGKYYGPLSYTIYNLLRTNGLRQLANNPDIAEKAMKDILPQWRQQQIVIESSRK